MIAVSTKRKKTIRLSLTEANAIIFHERRWILLTPSPRAPRIGDALALHIGSRTGAPFGFAVVSDRRHETMRTGIREIPYLRIGFTQFTLAE